MAKGKHSTALFEVIHSGNRPERVAQSLRTPKWWFKGKHSAPAATASEAEPAFADPAAAPPDPFPPAPPAPAFAPAPVAHDSIAAAPRASAPAARSMGPDHRRGRSSAVHFEFDRERKEVRLRLRYTTALVSGFGVCVLIGLSYVAGRHLGRGPRAALASEQPDIQQLMQQPPRPGVANLTRGRSAHSPQLSGGGTEQPRHSLQTYRPAPRVNPLDREPATLIPSGIESRLPRTIGLNYVIVQTYPPEERQAAEAARDFLIHHGIPCTLEKAADFTRNPNWICLMGTAGFVHISSPEYKAYVANILAAAGSFKTSHFNRWSPGAYKYKG